MTPRRCTINGIADIVDLDVTCTNKRLNVISSLLFSKNQEFC